MKKKIFVSILSMSLLFGGVVSAAGLWGSFKGNPVIRVNYNGVTLKTPDVPAISYNSRTMIPINMLGQLGLSYNWDQNNQTVNVFGNTSNGSSSHKDDALKASMFKYLYDLGEDLSVTKSNFDAAMLDQGIGTHAGLPSAKTSLTNVINKYNEFIKRDDVIRYTPQDGSITQALKYYYDSIDKLKEMDLFISTLTKYDNATITSYTVQAASVVNLINSGRSIAQSGFQKYIYEASK